MAPGPVKVLLPSRRPASLRADSATQVFMEVALLRLLTLMVQVPFDRAPLNAVLLNALLTLARRLS